MVNFISNFLMIVSVKLFSKSVNIWQRLEQVFDVSFLTPHRITTNATWTWSGLSAVKQTHVDRIMCVSICWSIDFAR